MGTTKSCTDEETVGINSEMGQIGCHIRLNTSLAWGVTLWWNTRNGGNYFRVPQLPA